MLKKSVIILVIGWGMLGINPMSEAANNTINPETQITKSKSKPSALESKINRLANKMTYTHLGMMFLFGAFCGLWAQNTGREALVWFFAGFFFNVIAVLILLSKNAADRKKERLSSLQ